MTTQRKEKNSEVTIETAVKSGGSDAIVSSSPLPSTSSVDDCGVTKVLSGALEEAESGTGGGGGDGTGGGGPKLSM